MEAEPLMVDTNILIDYLKQNQSVVDFVNTYSKSNLVICPIVLMEVYQGVQNKADLERTKKKLKGFGSVGMDEEVISLALSLQQTYILSHHIGIPDTLIAATALVYDLELRTFNLKDFRFIPTLKVSGELM
ncbi:MAG: tRNA(fMet)-specific endonuclease VapC [Spirosomataceae bacterium]|jgi:predicted nucleic acid-binding protein